MSYYQEFTPVDPMDNLRRYNPLFCHPSPQVYDSDQGYHAFDNFGPSTRLGTPAIGFNPMMVSDASCFQQNEVYTNCMHPSIDHSVPQSYMVVQESHVFPQQSTSYYPGPIIHEEIQIPSTPYDYSELLQVPNIQPQVSIPSRSSPPQKNTSPPPSPASPTGVTGSESDDSERDRCHPCAYCNKAFARAHDRKSKSC